MPSRPVRFAIWITLLLFGRVAFAAVTVRYTVDSIGGNVYRYTYSITNSSGSSAVQLFDILFDTSLYQESSLQIVTPAPLSSQWSQQILHSIPPIVPAAYDAFSIAGGIPAGTTVSGFAVQFTYLGSGTPGSQPFQVFDATTFTLLQTGATIQGPAPIPTASTVSLSLLGLGLAVAAAYQARLRTAEANRRPV